MIDQAISDPYASTERCVKRLLGEYRIHKSLIVAVDFDDTVFDFHEAGFEYPEVLRILWECQLLGFHLVLFTGTHPDKYESQIAYMAEHGIVIRCVNQNPIPLPFGNHGKMYYNILLDDRAGLGQACSILRQTIAAIQKETT